jgi:hypothetical protein
MKNHLEGNVSFYQLIISQLSIYLLYAYIQDQTYLHPNPPHTFRPLFGGAKISQPVSSTDVALNSPSRLWLPPQTPPPPPNPRGPINPTDAGNRLIYSISSMRSRIEGLRLRRDPSWPRSVLWPVLAWRSVPWCRELRRSSIPEPIS